MKEKKSDKQLDKTLRRRPDVTGLVAALGLAVLLILVCVLADTLEESRALRLDYSFNAVTTQSETTKEVLQDLQHPVHIYALFPRGDEDTVLVELLNRYAASTPLVTWEQTDPSLNPALLQTFRDALSGESVGSDSIIVSCEETGRFRLLSPTDFISLGFNMEDGTYEIEGVTYESSLTNAIAYVTKDSIPRAMILQGHGELDADGTVVLRDLLERNNLEVTYGTASELGLTEEGAADESVLLVLSPVRDLMDTELEAIRQYLENGGSVLFTCDYTDPVEEMPKWQSMLRAYGFLPKDGIVIASGEEPDTYYADRQLFLLPTMVATDLTQDLVEGGADTLLFAGSRAFEEPEIGDMSLITETLLYSGARSYLRSLDGDLSTLEQQPEDETGPFALGLQAERVTEGGELSRAVIIGCSTALTSSDLYAMTDSQEFIMRCMSYLTRAEKTGLSIMARAALRPMLSPASLQGAYLLTFLPPFVVMVLAWIMLFKRKAR
ncbi:MAG: Gldg family protein [Clostridia bacterium]|nr:Gldg family protein [Clostridia bacterium]